MLRNTLIAATALGLGALVFANHVAVPLSSAFGTEVLTDITFHQLEGVPHYRVTEGEVFQVPTGATFFLSDHSDHSDEIVLAGGAMTDAEVVAAINAQATMAVASIQNGHVVLESHAGGAATLLNVQEGTGGLAALGFAGGPGFGSDDVELTLSIPGAHEHGSDHEGGFAHHPYVLIASATAGTTQAGALEVPVAFDQTTTLFLRATRLGLLPGFLGELDHGGDASATVGGEVLGQLFPAGLPSELHFAFGVFSQDGSTLEFVSNRFTVHID